MSVRGIVLAWRHRHLLHEGAMWIKERTVSRPFVGERFNFFNPKGGFIGEYEVTGVGAPVVDAGQGHGRKRGDILYRMTLRVSSQGGAHDEHHAERLATAPCQSDSGS